MKQLVLASNNQGKIKEFTNIFASMNIEIIPQAKLNIGEIDEPYCTFIENALHKARHCSKITKLPVIADDSGICVNALGGKPGVLSARYAGTPSNDTHNNIKLIEQLKPYSDKSAFYYCVLVVLRSFDDPQPIIADGCLYGTIIEEPLGKNGFGYDSHFYIPKLNISVAQLDDEVKNQISHRANAIENLKTKLSIKG